MNAAAVDPAPVTQTIHRGLIADIQQRADLVAECTLYKGAPIRVSAFLARYLALGDEIEVRSPLTTPAPRFTSAKTLHPA